MNKSSMVDYIANRTGLSKTDSEKALNAFISGVTDTLSKRENITFVGFGTFSVVKRAPREGRNPRTGEVIKIDSSIQPKFRPGKMLRESIKNS